MLDVIKLLISGTINASWVENPSVKNPGSVAAGGKVGTA
jgi:hypothetical protein